MSGNRSAREEENLTRAKIIKQNITKDNMRMAVRVAAGIILSVVLAQLIGLAFAASTCIVTLLGIQATKRETLQTAGMRIVSIAYTMVIAVAIDKIMGVNINSFMAAVVILTFLTYVIGWNGTLSINVVVLVHMFIQETAFTGGLILNEVIRVMLGLIIALAINWRLPTKENEFLDDMSRIEKTMEDIMKKFANIMRGTEKLTEELGQHLKDLEETLRSGMDNAYTFSNNDLSHHAKYYMHYISLRETEALILYKVYLYIQKLSNRDIRAERMADYMDAIGHSIAMEHPMDDTRDKLKAVTDSLDSASLPTNKNDLNDIAMLYFIKGSLEEMMQAKDDFINELTEAEIERYWREEHHH